ncbi:MAG: hypothetical protein A2Y33_08290 [Spirochaetes bacterium GWF1_51_8]|nr:MAG: hypothetical protein A2Y33_08290 [Spirochaetes bacterium GWF1_51_8]
MDVTTAATSGQFSKPAVRDMGNIDQIAWSKSQKPSFHPIPIPFRSGLVEDGTATLVNILA